MNDDIIYEMTMFDVVEDVVLKGKESELSRDYVLARVENVIDARREMHSMSDEVAEYDSAVILALFNLMWPEESNG